MEKHIFTREDFTFESLVLGSLVDGAVVDDLMNVMPPACMRYSCSQLGEPYSHREDPESGKWRPTFATFRCVEGAGTPNSVWEYRGHCFRGESQERGKDPVYCSISA